jgi:hypothetical protein
LALPTAASQKDLSAADADLIEIALTTLNSLDKLRDLLRTRSKALKILDKRLSWEDYFANVQADLALVLSELPKFIAKARWTSPPEPSTSTSAVQRQNRFSSTVSPATALPQSSSSTSSAMSRTMRSEILALDLAHNKSRIKTLVHTLSSCGKAVEELMDQHPVPEIWLDKQDALEGDVHLEIDDLTEFLPKPPKVTPFLPQIVNQWRKADEFHQTARAIRNEAASLHRELDEAVLKLPERKRAASFGRTVASLQARSAHLREDIVTKTPRPLHSRVADQPQENERVIAELLAALGEANERLDKAATASATYGFAAEALERSRRVREDAQICVDRLVVLVPELDAFLVVLDDERCLTPDEEEPSRRKKGEEARAEVEEKEVEVDSITRRASECLVELQRARVDPNVRRDLKEVVQGLADSLARALEAARRRRQIEERCDKARAYASELKDADIQLAALAQLVEQELAVARRDTNGKGKEKEREWSDEAVVKLGEVSKTVDDSLGSSESLEGLAPRLRGHLELEADRVRFDVGIVKERVAALLRVRRQTDALDDMEREAAVLHAVIADLSGQLREAAAVPREADQAREESLTDQVPRVGADVNRFIDSLASRLPLVSSNSPSSSSSGHPRLPPARQPHQHHHRRVSSRRVSQSAVNPLATLVDAAASADDFESLDRTARNVANSTAAGLAGALDDLGNASRGLDWARQVRRFNGVLEAHDGSCSALDSELRDGAAAEEERRSLTDLHKAASEEVAALSRTRIKLETLGLDNAAAAAEATGQALFREREERLVTLEEKAGMLVRAVEDAMDAEAKREAEARRLKEEAERLKREEDGRIAGWEERIRWTEEKVRGAESVLESLESELTELASRVVVPGRDWTRKVSWRGVCTRVGRCCIEVWTLFVDTGPVRARRARCR